MARLASIESLHIHGFRSLVDVSVTDLPNAMVFIGPNGSGKSNFINFFAMMSFMRGRRFASFVEHQGGADDQLFGGSRRTPRLTTEVSLRTRIGRGGYRFTLSHTQPDNLTFEEEAFQFGRTDWRSLGRGHSEAALADIAYSGDNGEVSTYDLRAARAIMGVFDISSIHDMDDISVFRRMQNMSHAGHLHTAGSNLAAVLNRIRHEDVHRYRLICRQIGRILPGFESFVLDDDSQSSLLQWKTKWGEKIIKPHLTSRGSLRFFALVTLLNLPSDMLTDVMLIDEPELGLHPSAVALIGEMIKSVATEQQIIVVTQSPRLVDLFDIDEIFVLQIEEGRTVIKRLSLDDYRMWRDEYTSGALWEKNLFGGRP